jgi:hypothetical protein
MNPKSAVKTTAHAMRVYMAQTLDAQVTHVKQNRSEGRTVETRAVTPESHSGRLDGFCKPATQVHVGSNPTSGSVGL